MAAPAVAAGVDGVHESNQRFAPPRLIRVSAAARDGRNGRGVEEGGHAHARRRVGHAHVHVAHRSFCPRRSEDSVLRLEPSSSEREWPRRTATAHWASQCPVAGSTVRSSRSLVNRLRSSVQSTTRTARIRCTRYVTSLPPCTTLTRNKGLLHRRLGRAARNLLPCHAPLHPHRPTPQELAQYPTRGGDRTARILVLFPDLHVD